MITVDSLKILESLKIHEEGEAAFVVSESKVYKYIKDKWVEQYIPEGKLNLNIYDMNKMVIKQFPPIEDKTILNEIRKFANKQGKYFMLISREIGYYTLFVKGEGEDKLEVEVLNCLHDLGTIKGLEKIDETEAIEIWIQSSEEEEPFVGYFFNYDKGVVLCK